MVEEELRRATQSEDRVVLDLRRVTFMDSTGVRVMIAADQRIHDRGGSLAVVQGSDQLRRLFELVGISGHLETVDDVAEGGPVPQKSA